MITVSDLVDSLGPGLLRTIVPARDAEVHDVAVAEPGDAAGQPGELVLGVGVTDRAGALALLAQLEGMMNQVADISKLAG